MGRYIPSLDILGRCEDIWLETLVTIMAKTCSKCKEDKPLSEFHKRNDRACGYKSLCKVCGNAANKKWRTTSIGHLKQYYIDNKDEFRRRDKEYKARNRDFLNEKARIIRIKNPEIHRQRCREWRENN